MRGIHGMSLAIAAALMASQGVDVVYPQIDDRPKTKKRFKLPEVERGPVIDSTPESKRAKRRRLQKAPKPFTSTPSIHGELQ